MNIDGAVALVTGAASGLGKATAAALQQAGARVVLVDQRDIETSSPTVEDDGSVSVEADITNETQLARAFDTASRLGALRVVVHCAGRGGGVQPLLNAQGQADADAVTNFETVLKTNVSGSFHILRLAATHLARTAPVSGERGAIVLTSSIAAFEGQTGQIAYAASKAAINGMTLVAARDLAPHLIRVCTIAPGLFDTGMLSRLAEDARTRMQASIPHPRRLGHPAEFAQLALHVVHNPMLNGEVIRLDAANRLPSGL